MGYLETQDVEGEGGTGVSEAPRGVEKGGQNVTRGELLLVADIQNQNLNLNLGTSIQNLAQGRGANPPATRAGREGSVNRSNEPDNVYVDYDIYINMHLHVAFFGVKYASSC